MQILFPGVHLIEGELEGRPAFLPLLVGSAGAMLIDAGTREIAEERVLPALKEILGGPERLRWIVTTHPDADHQGGNSLLKRAAPGAILACGTADRDLVEDPERLLRERYDACRADHGVACSDEFLGRIRRSSGDPQQVDATFAGGERIRLDAGWLLEVIHLPGHSRGHLAVLDHRHRALYAGDALHGGAYPGLDGSPKLPPAYREVDHYLDSVRTVLALARGGAITTYAGSHWPLKRGEEEIASFCEETRRFSVHAEQLILAEIRRAENLRLSELLERLGPQLGKWPRSEDLEFRHALTAHLEHLERRGAVRSDRKSGIKVYRG